jgi:hypothetical protein
MEALVKTVPAGCSLSAFAPVVMRRMPVLGEGILI